MARYALLRLRRHQTEAEPVTEVNIIPVIDISLVLLVILFVTSPMLSVPNVAVDLPKTAAPESKEETIAVTFTKDEQLTVRAAGSGWETLETDVARELKRTPDSIVLLRVDRAVPYRLVQRLMAAAQRAGARRISFGTEPIR